MGPLLFSDARTLVDRYSVGALTTPPGSGWWQCFLSQLVTCQSPTQVHIVPAFVCICASQHTNMSFPTGDNRKSSVHFTLAQRKDQIVSATREDEVCFERFCRRSSSHCSGRPCQLPKISQSLSLVNSATCPGGLWTTTRVPLLEDVGHLSRQLAEEKLCSLHKANARYFAKYRAPASASFAGRPLCQRV